MSEGEIKSIDELRKAQAAAQAQGTNITNYSHWEQVLEDLETAGIESTGSYSGDVQLHSQVMKQVEEMMEQLQEVQSQQELQPQHDETGKIDEKPVRIKNKPLKQMLPME